MLLHADISDLVLAAFERDVQRLRVMVSVDPPAAPVDPADPDPRHAG